jgi:hypothetical protein
LEVLVMRMKDALIALSLFGVLLTAGSAEARDGKGAGNYSIGHGTSEQTVEVLHGERRSTTTWKNTAGGRIEFREKWDKDTTKAEKAEEEAEDGDASASGDEAAATGEEAAAGDAEAAATEEAPAKDAGATADESKAADIEKPVARDWMKRDSTFQ